MADNKQEVILDRETLDAEEKEELRGGDILMDGFEENEPEPGDLAALVKYHQQQSGIGQEFNPFAKEILMQQEMLKKLAAGVDHSQPVIVQHRFMFTRTQSNFLQG